jgi:hypothetical protein
MAVERSYTRLGLFLVCDPRRDYRRFAIHSINCAISQDNCRSSRSRPSTVPDRR